VQSIRLQRYDRMLALESMMSFEHKGVVNGRY
jgi:hypothetical protein